MLVKRSPKRKLLLERYLPEEIIHQILVRLPVKYLLKFAAVCKSWNCLIKSPTFIRNHLIRWKIQSGHQNAGDDQLLLQAPKFGVYTLYKDIPRSSTLAEYTQLMNPFLVYNKSTFSKNKINVDLVGTCNGLVCLVAQDTEFTAIIWNPSARKFMVLPKPGVALTSRCDEPRYAFGYDSHADDYKVLRRVNSYCPCDTPYQVEIWSLARGSWKSLSVDVVPKDLDFLSESDYSRDCPTTFVSGAVHWAEIEKRERKHFIASFDMSTESFGKIMLSKDLKQSINSAFKRSNWVVSRYRESLSFVIRSKVRGEYSSSICVWVMKEYGVTESWVELYRVCFDRAEVDMKLFGFRKSGDELVFKVSRGEDEEVSVEVLDLKTLRVSVLQIGGDVKKHIFIDTFTESLVLLDQPNLFTC